MRLSTTLALIGPLLIESVHANQDWSVSLVQPGEALPALVLPTIDGKATVDLADLRGKKVLLIQFASW
ncbi:MAG TPA: hypothetical protein EYQ74_12175 [Planctomycetes bacterium]|nr:hypothetical protein [Planctomycetota bacterium]HIK59774.1 hypothetical protein [Planctomycetota bacterium]